MAAIRDIVSVKFVSANMDQRLHIDAKSRWEAKIMSHINFKMATLTFTFVDYSNVKMVTTAPKDCNYWPL